MNLRSELFPGLICLFTRKPVFDFCDQVHLLLSPSIPNYKLLSLSGVLIFMRLGRLDILLTENEYQRRWSGCAIF